MLTGKQLKTIEHLRYIQKKTDPQEIVSFCVYKLSLPFHSFKQNGKILHHTRATSRKHSKRHYLGIIEYFEKRIPQASRAS